MKKIVFCIPGKSFSNNFLKCWTQLYSACLQFGIKPILSNAYSSNVYYARTLCLNLSNNGGIYQRPFNGMDYDYICWIDSDMTFCWEDLKRLLDHDKDVISGIYLMQDRKHYTTVLEWDENYFQNNGSYNFINTSTINTLKTNSLRKCAYTGLGFTLIKRGIFERIEYPPFKPFTKIYNGDGGDVVDFASEDVSFFKKLEELGIESYVDLNVQLGHEKNLILK